MSAAFGTVHAAAFGAVAVVQDFGRIADNLGALRRLEHEGRHGGGILAEVHHQRFTGVQFHHFPVGIAALDVHHAIFHFLFLLRLHGAGDTLPDINLGGTEPEVFTLIDFRTASGKDLALELGVHLGRGEFLRRLIAHRDAGVVLLAVKNARMGHRAGNAGLPVLRIGSQALDAAVGIGEFHHAAESALEALHGVHVPGGDNLVGPPTGSHLGTELVLRTGLAVQGRGNVIGKGTLGLEGMRETGFQHFPADPPAVHIQVIHAQAGRHPDRLFDFLSVLDGGQEPTGAGGAGITFLSGAFGHRSVGGGNPLRGAPGCILEGGDQREFFRTHFPGCAGNHCSGHDRNDKSKRNLFHIGILFCLNSNTGALPGPGGRRTAAGRRPRKYGGWSRFRALRAGAFRRR